ncbi:NAD-dependent epimerase/dehydratase family protein [Candidatus Planktophila limnetica]|nr:NAD(P)-dependent oxidoreductase [Candidatus Planktophila limnetica]
MASHILMVGHTGFIGQAILSMPTNIQFKLTKNRINLEVTESSDLMIKEAITSNCGGILDLAWQSNKHDDYDNLKTHSKWQIETEYLARAAAKAGLKVYLVGTGEDDHPPASNKYATAKFQLKESLRDLIRAGQVIWLRPFYIVSIIQQRPRIIRGILESETSNFTIESPQSTNDFILVEDVALGIIKCLENETSGEIDIGSGALTSNIQIARIVCDLRNLPIPKTGFKPMRQGNIANIENLKKLKWAPTYTKKFLTGAQHE